MSKNNQYKNVAVVILNWNGAEYLQKFLPSVVDNTNNEIANIFVIDNNSQDESLEVLKKFPTVEVIILDKNYGFSGGYNKGLELIDSKYYLLLNSDIEVPPNWIEPLYSSMESDLNLGICGPKLLSYDDKTKFEYAGAAGGFICRGRIFEHLETDNGQYDKPEKCFWVSGAALMVRRDLFVKAGQLDEDFFAHQEEIDLCWRVINLGYEIMCVPKSYVYHVGGGTLNKSNPYKTYLNFRNNLFLIQKNTKKIEGFKILFIRFFLDYIAFVRMILQANFKEAFAVVKAYFHFWSKINLMNKKRKTIQAKSTKQISSICRKSIVYQYFVRKVNRFSDI